jgi:hypothetical protein
MMGAVKHFRGVARRGIRAAGAGLLLLLFLGMGTGSLEYLHNLGHAMEDARADAIARAAGKTPEEDHHHDENNCEVHSLLHLPVILISSVQVLICLGVLVAFLTMIAGELVSRGVPARTDCRGPPVGFSLHLVAI